MRILYLLKNKTGMIGMKEAFSNLGIEGQSIYHSNEIHNRGFRGFCDYILSISKQYDWIIIPKADFSRGSFSQCISFLKRVSSITNTYHFMHDAILSRNIKRRKKLISYANACTVCSTSYICNLELYKKHGVHRVSQVYQGFEDNWFFPINHVKKKYDVIFIGQIKKPKIRETYIDFLKRNNINVHIFSKIPQEKTNLYYNLSKICINILDEQYFSNRSLRIMGAGGFLLSSENKDLTASFKKGKDFETYITKKELLKKIQYYLKNDMERKKIAESGNKSVQKYSWNNQVKKMIKVMNGEVIMDGYGKESV